MLCPEERMDLQIRPATREDAPFLVPLINAGSRGLAIYTWTAEAQPGEDPWELALRHVSSDDYPVSWRKAWIAEVSEEPAGLLFAYRLPDAPEEVEHSSISPIFDVLDELEAEAHGTGHVYLMSVAEPVRGQGVGTALLAFAERWRGPRGMSLIVSDNNEGARRLYERQGYAEVGRRRMVKLDWESTGTDWILMRKP
jgi:ribosomal protein S18 acetylase RimI-like enzyme